MTAYLMVCLHHESFNPAVAPIPKSYQEHELWDTGNQWKNLLNNLQLILEPPTLSDLKSERNAGVHSAPFICFNLTLRWLKVFPIPQLSLGFPRLLAKFHEFDCLRLIVYCWDDFFYSSA